METRLDWLAASPLDHSEWMLPWLCALERSSPAPEALIIWDDHLVEPCTRLLKTHCPSLAKRLHICAHANFPDISRSHLDSYRFGIDWDDAFEQAFDLLERQRHGAVAPLDQQLAIKTLTT